MDKLNSSNLYGKYSNGTNKPLNIHTISYPSHKKRKFSINNLINRREEKKKAVEEEYKKIFNDCLDTIDSIDNLDKTDLIYDIPSNVFRCSDYDPKTCMERLQVNLRRLYMDTLVLTDKSIFISWFNIKKNKQMQKKQNKTK